MERAQQALNSARFRARGKWYSAQQVDEFLQRLSVLLEEDRREAEDLRGENTALRARLEEAQAALAREREEGEKSSARRVCQELERQRDSLIQDIKDLKAFREEFRQAVARDGAALLQDLEKFSSQRLL